MAQEPPSEVSEIAGSLVPVARQDAILLLESGYLWIDLGQLEKARNVFVGAAALMPRSEVPQIALGTLEFAQGHYDKALKAYRSAQRLAPRSALPRAHVGEALLFLGKAPQATKELEAAVALEPDSPGARFAQALLEAQAGGAFAHLDASSGKGKKKKAVAQGDVESPEAAETAEADGE